MLIHWYKRRAYARYLRALEHGQFRRVVKDPQALRDWVERQASIPHTDLVALRLPQQDWTLWASYRIVDTNPIYIRLDGLFIPVPDWPDQHAQPEELEGVPVYDAATCGRT